METLENSIIQRYFRKVTAHPEGAVVHHADCEIFSIKICTCGLHHDLRGAMGAFILERYPRFDEEIAASDAVRDRLLTMGRTRTKKKTRSS